MVTDPSQADWHKAAASAHNGGCVEIAGRIPAAPGCTGIRDTRNRQQGAHVVTKAAFAAFITDARNGRYDL